MPESTIAKEATPSSTTGPFRWRRHPALRKPHLETALSEAAPIAPRQTRLAAVRGVQAARDGRIEAASQWFAEAAEDPAITFQNVPGFWDCSRGGMQAAVDAYEAAERFRDASTLAAIIRTRYRPRAVAPLRVSPPAPAPDQPEDRARSTGD